MTVSAGTASLHLGSGHQGNSPGCLRDAARDVDTASQQAKARPSASD